MASGSTGLHLANRATQLLRSERMNPPELEKPESLETETGRQETKDRARIQNWGNSTADRRLSCRHRTYLFLSWCGGLSMPIYLDADACPVKDEVYRVARRYLIKVYVVANAPLRVPSEELIELVVVRGGFDIADDWIAERIGQGDIAITTDIPLADRCLRRGARVLGPKGLEFTEDAIGDALATRALLDMLRQSGEFGGGPAPFTKSDRSRFLAKLDETVHAIRRDLHKRDR